MDRNHSPESPRRRTLLKTIGFGGSLLTAGLPGTVSARDDAEHERRLYQKSLKVKEKTDGVGNWRKFLRNSGFGLSTKRIVYQFTPGTEDEVSTERIYDYNITFDLTLSIGCAGNYYGDLSWRYDLSEGSCCPSPEQPIDNAAITWDDDKWQLATNSSYYSSDNCTNHSYVGEDGYTVINGSAGIARGIGFDVDAHWALNTGCIDRLFYIGGRIEPIGDWSSDERPIGGAYAINYSGGSVDSISVSYPYGISVTSSWETNTENVTYNGTGSNKEFLRVFQSDASYQC